MEKKCTVCGESKDLKLFFKEKLGKYGRRSKCKVCFSAATKKWARDNPDKVSAYGKKYRRGNRKKYLAYKVKYRLENKEKIKKARREHYWKNRDAILAKKREWVRNNPDKVSGHRERNKEAYRLYAVLRRTRIRGNGGSFTVQEWQELCEKYHNKCLCCKEEKFLTVDHVVPVSKGGTSNIDNIQPLCTSCNCTKQARVIDYR